MHKYTKEEVINAAKRADKKSEGPLSRINFIRTTGIREWMIENLFPDGGWTELKRLAKIKSHPIRSKTLSHKKAFAKETVNSEFNRLEITGTKSTQEIILPPMEFTDPKSTQEITQPPISPPAPSKEEREQLIRVEIAEFGELIDFRGLRHAPINENGVIYLFGMVSYELGFMVEAVHAVFPDCEAKRLIDKNRYQRIRIKFEYKSSNFKSHGFDPTGADMIVCWVHDWPECPLEALELRSAIDKLES